MFDLKRQLQISHYVAAQILCKLYCTDTNEAVCYSHVPRLHECLHTVLAYRKKGGCSESNILLLELILLAISPRKKTSG
jgi:hypothetical protein